MKQLERIILYPKDIQNITGKKDQAARKLHQLIKEAMDKPEHGLVTVDDFCAYTGITKEEVIKFIN